MKFNQWILWLVMVGMVCLAVEPALAQRGFDSFNVPKTLVVNGGQNYGPVTGAITNGPFDLRVIDGLASLDVFYETNVGTTGGTMTLTIQTSSSTNNFANVTGLAFINSTTALTYTNSASTNIFATDNFLIPGTYTNLVPAINFAAGWALLPPVYTNTGALTLPTGYSKVGWAVDDSSRYGQVIFQPGGTVTNCTTGATLTGVNPTPLR